MTVTTIEQLPAQVNLKFVRGDSFARRLRFFIAPDTAVNVSDWTIEAQIRPSSGSSEAVAFTVALATDGTDGLVDISLTAEDTAELGRVNAWDLQRTVDGDALTLLSGLVEALRQVSE